MANGSGENNGNKWYDDNSSKLSHLITCLKWIQESNESVHENRKKTELQIVFQSLIAYAVFGSFYHYLLLNEHKSPNIAIGMGLLLTAVIILIAIFSWKEISSSDKANEYVVNVARESEDHILDFLKANIECSFEHKPTSPRENIWMWRVWIIIIGAFMSCIAIIVPMWNLYMKCGNP